jgi:hypothetical protein
MTARSGLSIDHPVVAKISEATIEGCAEISLILVNEVGSYLSSALAER